MPLAGPPPIALTSLEIRDFRGIDHLKIDLLGPDGEPNRLLVLAGPNGTGKTAVLEAALIALGGEALAVGGVGKRVVRRGAEDYEIRAHLLDRSRPIPMDEVIVKTAESAPDPGATALPHWYFSSWRAPKFVGSLHAQVETRGRKRAKNDQNRLRNVKQRLVNGATSEYFPEPRNPASPLYSAWVERINEAWAKYYPLSQASFRVGRSQLDADGDGAFDVFYERASHPSLPVDYLSAGQMELFLFLAALVLNDDRAGIVLIDEPELHLDPQWHAPILRSLMRLQPHAQFLVATHSTGICRAAASYERRFLVAEDDPRAAEWSAVGVEV